MGWCAQARLSSVPIRVIYVIASMIVGGTQTHLLQMFRFLDRSRFEPALVTLRKGGTLVEEARALGVEVTELGVSGSLRTPGDVGGLWRLARLLRRRRAHVVHGYLLRGNFYGAVAAKIAGVPVVVTSKRGLHEPASWAERLAVRVSNNLSTVITGNSPAVLEFTRRVEAPVRVPLVMIPSGIDLDRFDPARADDGLRAEICGQGEPTIGTVTTFRPKKGYPMLFESFARVRQRVPAARLLIAGEDKWEDEPASLARRLDVYDAVTLLGKRSDMPRVYSAFDVFVLASRSEGMSNALLEAMAMKRPVVATAVGGNPTVLDGGRYGYLADYGDADAMADHIVGLLAAPERRQALGEAARERVAAEYSAQAMVRKTERLYEELFEKAKSPARS